MMESCMRWYRWNLIIGPNASLFSNDSKVSLRFTFHRQENACQSWCLKMYLVKHSAETSEYFQVCWPCFNAIMRFEYIFLLTYYHSEFMFKLDLLLYSSFSPNYTHNGVEASKHAFLISQKEHLVWMQQILRYFSRQSPIKHCFLLPGHGIFSPTLSPGRPRDVFAREGEGNSRSRMQSRHRRDKARGQSWKEEKSAAPEESTTDSATRHKK